jgi:hypothetical protein
MLNIVNGNRAMIEVVSRRRAGRDAVMECIRGCYD